MHELTITPSGHLLPREVETGAKVSKPLLDAYAESAARLDAWHDAGRSGERPPGRLRRLEVPELNRVERLAALVPYLTVHDPDGRPGPLRKSDGY